MFLLFCKRKRERKKGDKFQRQSAHRKGDVILCDGIKKGGEMQM